MAGGVEAGNAMNDAGERGALVPVDEADGVGGGRRVRPDAFYPAGSRHGVDGVFGVASARATMNRGVGLGVLAGQGAQIDTTTAAGRLVFGIVAAPAGRYFNRPEGPASGRFSRPDVRVRRGRPRRRRRPAG